MHDLAEREAVEEDCARAIRSADTTREEIAGESACCEDPRERVLHSSDPAGLGDQTKMAESHATGDPVVRHSHKARGRRCALPALFQTSQLIPPGNSGT